MKRASILGALAIVAGFFLAAPAAHAYNPVFPCQKYPVNPPPTAQWPDNGHFFVCTSPNFPTLDTKASLIYQAAKATEAPLKAKLSAANVDIFVMSDRNFYDIYPDFATDVPSASHGNALVAGYTICTQGANHPGPVIAVFEFRGGIPIPDADMFEHTAHEIGHAMDGCTYGGLPLSERTGTNKWRTLFLQDLIDFDALAPNAVNWSQLPASCQSQTKHSTKLLCEEHNLNPFEPKETFADEYAKVAQAGTLPQDVGQKLGTYFTKGASNPPNTRYRSMNYIRDLKDGLIQP